MPARCIFRLSRVPISALVCDSRAYAAFSGEKGHENNPGDTALAGKGPLPIGRYYIVDRRGGGHLGWLWDELTYLFNGVRREDWFALYRKDGMIDDRTFVHGVQRGNFRLHPRGRRGISEGCITLMSPQQFKQLRLYLRSLPTQLIPGTAIPCYGTVDVP